MSKIRCTSTKILWLADLPIGLGDLFTRGSTKFVPCWQKNYFLACVFDPVTEITFGLRPLPQGQTFWFHK